MNSRLGEYMIYQVLDFFQNVVHFENLQIALKSDHYLICVIVAEHGEILFLANVEIKFTMNEYM